MKILKKLLLIFIISVLLFSSLFLMTKIYAKYLTSLNGSANIAISRWNLKVNNISVKNNIDISNTITPIFPGNENIAAGIIAPSAEGYFDLTLDYNDVDVSFKYSIDITPAPNSAITDIILTGFSLDNAPKTSFNDTKTTKLEDTIPLSNTKRNRSLRIFLKWNDDPNTEFMNNEDDTASTIKSTNQAILNVKVLFTQVI